MKAKTILATAAAVAAGTAVLAPSLAERRAGFDPLLAGAPTCMPAQPGRPPLLEGLVLAQAETAPFRPSGKAAEQPATGMPPLYGNLGTLSMPVTTQAPKAQAYFNQGLRLTFGFNHAEAARAFRAARTIDPDCAMCWWGEALVLGPNINAPMFPQAVEPAYAAAQAALKLAPRAKPVEQALIRAVARRYDASPTADRGALDKAYAAAMTDAARPSRTTIPCRCCSPNR